MKKIPQDIIGDIAILKFKSSTPWLIKKLRARKFLKSTPSVKTVVEKMSKFSGRLRTHQTKHLAGFKTKIANYRENNLIFKFNIDEAYFSPRLSNERKITALEILKITKKNSKILVMFAGIAPYPITIAKELKKKKKSAKVFSNELNRKANSFAKENIHINKLSDYIELIPGDAKKLSGKFDIILMTRPNLKDTFLPETLKLSKSGTTIFYHGFGTKESVLDEIKKSCGSKISKISIRKAGDIGKHKFRWLARFKVK